MPDPPPLPPIPDAVRRELVRRLRTFADDWQAPNRVRGGAPAQVAQRRTEGRRLHAFAETVLYEQEDLGHAGDQS